MNPGVQKYRYIDSERCDSIIRVMRKAGLNNVADVLESLPAMPLFPLDAKVSTRQGLPDILYVRRLRGTVYVATHNGEKGGGVYVRLHECLCKWDPVENTFCPECGGCKF